MKKILAVAVALLAVAIASVIIYFEVIKGDPPSELGFTDAVETSTTTGGAAPTSVPALDGEWTATGESVVGYRVIEDIIGGLQSNEAVGRTSDVEGTIVISGTTIGSASFTADLRTLKSDEQRRDEQVQERILNTAEFPTSTFTLTKPIVLDAIPLPGTEIVVTAIGNLELHGVTREVMIGIRAKHSGDRIEIVSQIPIVFADYDIPNPSNPFVSARDNGTLEVLLVLERA